MNKKSLMTIGELAKEMSVTVRTLQYYDKEGLFKPSTFSEGGRRLYSSKDIVMLHQILAFKYLGFSLDEIKKMIVSIDTPQQVAKILAQQRKNIEMQIENLQSALYAVDTLQSEVLRTEQVDFKKYAEIIQFLRSSIKGHWVWKCFDDSLTKHLHSKFFKEPEKVSLIWETYKNLLEQSFYLQQKNEPPDSEHSLQLAKEWWDMVTEFTDGDMSLIPKLIEFNSDKADWDEEMAKKQKTIDSYLENILTCYFIKNGIHIPEMGQKQCVRL